MSDNLCAESLVTCHLCHAIGTNHCGHVNCPLPRLVVPAAMVIDGAEMRAKITADVAAESAGNVAYWNANRAVVEAARRLRKARTDWARGCPDSLLPFYADLDAALDVVDGLEKRSC
jgi:hypothetical protein